MSASLVGSEMCIRDRLTVAEQRPATASHRSVFVLVSRHDGDPPRRVGAVSYTHLTLPTICSV
eukprot:6327972-Alexandrium_andersonii.AAC.1